MKIAIVIHEYPPYGGGASTAARATARALVELGHQVAVLTAGHSLRVERELDDGVIVIRLPSLRLRNLAPSALELMSFAFGASTLLKGCIRDFGADGILAYFAVPSG
ncbi:MAG: glycosyltransferase, partial [Deltaproteobacteria bacterium]|nr:glycosyltransferase [Deltaproteobacteria bacterium]